MKHLFAIIAIALFSLGLAAQGMAGGGQVARMTVAMAAIKQSSDEVEEARAGEAGHGFAVVADEVRNLAKRSATAAKETSVKIADSMTKANTGVAISKEVAATFSQIMDKVRTVDSGVAKGVLGQGRDALLAHAPNLQAGAGLCMPATQVVHDGAKLPKGGSSRPQTSMSPFVPPLRFP